MSGGRAADYGLVKPALAVLRFLLWAEAVLFLAASIVTPFTGWFQRYGAIVAIESVYGVGALLGAWGLSSRKKWGRVAGLIISAMNVFFFPIGTLPGIFGLIVLFTKRAKVQLEIPELPNAPQPMRPSLAGKVVGVVLVVTGVAGAHVLYSYLHKHGVRDFPLLLIPLEIVGALWLGVFIHELGHCIAGWAGGLRITLISMGPLMLTREDGNWQVKFSRRLMWSGYTGAVPAENGCSHEAAMLFAAGGPLASLLFGLCVLLLCISTPGTRWAVVADFLAISSIVSLQTFLGNALPFQYGGGYTDGGHFLQLWRRDVRGARWMSMLSFGLTESTRLRPRDCAESWIAQEQACRMKRMITHPRVFTLMRIIWTAVRSRRPARFSIRRLW